MSKKNDHKVQEVILEQLDNVSGGNELSDDYEAARKALSNFKGNVRSAEFDKLSREFDKAHQRYLGIPDIE